MSMLQPLFLLLDIEQRHFNDGELKLLEAELFMRITEEFREIIRNQNKDYYKIMKLKKENFMLENQLIRCVINDILSTEEYDLAGIAFYTDVPEDVIYDLASGCNENPTFLLSRKIIELHRMVRPALYQKIAQKIKDELTPTI